MEWCANAGTVAKTIASAGRSIVSRFSLSHSSGDRILPLEVIMRRLALPFFCVLLLTRVPAFAQMDFSGEWAPVQDEDDTGDPHVGEFIGIPMSHQGRLRAEEWNASLYTLPEWQCRPHGAMYISRGPSQVRIWKEVYPVSRQITAYHAEWLRSVDNPYFMDGRPHPASDLAPHTWGGFSTAAFEGEMLRITTTHLKEDYYRRNGVPSSDRATLTQYWIRRGDILTWVTIAYDSLYLSEPMIRSSEYRYASNQQITPYPCTSVEEVDRPQGVVPHYLPGTNPFLKEFGAKYNIPIEATLGGAASMYPELPRKIQREQNGKQ